MHFLSLLDISFRYRVACLLLSRFPLLHQWHGFLYKITYAVGYHDVSQTAVDVVSTELENSHCFRPNYHFAPFSTALQNIKCYLFKCGYILRYKLSKMHIFCLDNWRQFFPLRKSIRHLQKSLHSKYNWFYK